MSAQPHRAAPIKNLQEQNVKITKPFTIIQHFSAECCFAQLTLQKLLHFSVKIKKIKVCWKGGIYMTAEFSSALVELCLFEILKLWNLNISDIITFEMLFNNQHWKQMFGIIFLLFCFIYFCNSFCKKNHCFNGDNISLTMRNALWSQILKSTIIKCWFAEKCPAAVSNYIYACS